MSVNVIVSHKGKKHDVEVDPESTGEVFKYQLFSLTGVEPDRQKILVKGGQLKDETVMGKLGLKAGQTIMMMGTPGGGGDGLRRPKEVVKFVEDMTEAEAARQEGATPAGLENLGNTCYLNSTLQVMRSIPELQEALRTYEFKITGPRDVSAQLDLTSQLRRLYKSMAETQSGFAPFTFLQALRSAFPQFAEKAKDGHGFAQQDAEEAWSQIVAQLRLKLELKKRSEDESTTNLVDRYMAGEFTSVLECDEQAARDAGEEAVTSVEPFLKLNCHIQKDTNHLRDGIMNALTETIEKRSSALDREAVYTKRSKISRLPKFLTVHFVRFFWKREVQKKAKIMRKVTFPHELDVVEFCVDDLKKLLIPVRDKVREVRKDEEDMERASKRRKKNHLLDGDEGSSEQSSSKDSKKKDDKKGKGASTSADGDIEMEGETFKTDAEVQAEREATLLEAKRELYGLISQNQGAKDGDNLSGLYELRGVVTHQGASADSGHYTAYVKKTAPVDPTTGKPKESEDGNWWWFNDDKVSEVTADKIDGLAGGGESHSALILLYRAISLPSAEDVGEKA
ncbi:ubiquitin carboxyl-terminal hydrolase 6 [Gaeumannomyces tritici R3-111a-1]|uniref:Ubiquitin carboxyl-terminal hydrolase n=1 Tax=Gaeumannomyces tritici (strain R3-111a-1) TaxID=644352 RepID=J3NUH2_GAET3|nr:ubiquitin carboxyl-terminal hydrolase 6 [Gaeumannomyces tritici R3-111a-1]EJT79845.1 ubiquitin carboxyl-terminal hydrolase 6 [Gaeumannomyces tritici R3-111a-1]